MREILRNRFCLMVLSLLLIAGCHSDKKQQTAESGTTRYTCPMHPQIVSDQPGTCPICHMDLVAVSGHGQVQASDSLKYLVKPTNQLVQSSIATVRPQRGKRFQEEIIRGVINYDSNNWKSISSRVSGRIERLFIKYNYQPVQKGQKIMEIYSPDLANAQQELLFLKQNNEPELLEAAKQKLRLLGISEQQISHTLRSGKVDYTVSIYSPYQGYLAEGNVTAPNQAAASPSGGTMVTGNNAQAQGEAMSGGSAMGGSESQSSSSIPAINKPGPLSVREGQYVTAGQKLFNLINPSSLWAEFYLRPEQLDVIRKGTTLEISPADDPSLKIHTTVSLIQPYYNEGSNFTVARAVIENAGRRWRVGQLINVNTASEGIAGSWIPRKAVLQMGGRYVAFLKQPGGFRPVFVQVKNLTNDWADIGNSLSSTAEIAVDAWFLVDSESFIKPDSVKL